MQNFMAFISEFASYAIVFAIFITAIIASCKIGIAIRKKQDSKA